MRKLSVVFVLLAAVSPALAQPSASFTVTEQDAANLRAYLNRQPYEFSAPLMQWLENAIAKARAEAAAKAVNDARSGAKPPPSDHPN